MINMITKMDMNGQFKEVKINGKNRLIYYLDETVNIDELQKKHKLTWKQASMCTRDKLAAGAAVALGLLVGYTYGHTKGADKLHNHDYTNHDASHSGARMVTTTNQDCFECTNPAVQ